MLKVGKLPKTKHCGDFSTPDTCAANKGHCEWKEAGQATCTANSDWEKYFQNSDNCAKFGGSMQYTSKSNCDAKDKQLKPFNWNEAQQMTGSDTVTFLEFDQTTVPSSKVVRCTGTLSYNKDKDFVTVIVTAGSDKCKSAGNTEWNQDTFNKMKVLHASNEAGCTNNGCVVDSANMKCVEPSVVCTAAHQDTDNCPSDICKIITGGVPTCAPKDDKQACSDITTETVPSYCTPGDKSSQVCILPSTHQSGFAGECQLNAADASNKTCALLSKDLKSQDADAANGICEYTANKNGVCVGNLE